MQYVPRPTTHLLSPGLYSTVVDLAGRLGTHDVRRAFADEGFPQWVVPPSARPLTQEELPQSKLKAFAVVAATSLAATAMTARDLARDYLQWAEEHAATHGLLLVAVIEELLWLDQQHADDEEYDPEPAARLIRRLEKDGYRLDDRGRLHPPATLFLDSALDQVQDPQVIRQLLDRIRKSLPDDPMLAIGSAKELVEATCRTALAAKGIEAPRSLDLPELVKQAQEALGIHPAGAGVDGTEVVRRLLGKLSGVANDLAHLRNGHGTGHAPTKADATLRARHGRLAVGAADVWCTFMLDTLQER